MPTLARILAIFLAGASVLNANGASADEEDHDHDRALELYEHGEIRSLADILSFLKDRINGDIVDVTLDRRDDHWTYRLTVVTTDGQRMHLAVDAGSMAIVEEATP